MSTPYNSIPPERELAFMQNAAEAVDQAIEPIVEGLGKLAVIDAVELIDSSAKGASLGDEAGQYIIENDEREKFKESVDKISNTTIADEAQNYLDFETEVEKKRPYSLDHQKSRALKYLELKAKTDDEIERLRVQIAQDPGSLKLDDYDQAVIASHSPPEESDEESD